MFAGPNGSGKSTIKSKFVEQFPRLLGVYINPDDIERSIRETGRINFADFKIRTSRDEIFAALNTSTLLREKGLLSEVAKLGFRGNSLYFNDLDLNSYFVSPVADFLHESLLASGKSFAFETVMSHPHKIALLQNSLAAGFRNYLYYVATEDPELNISRVAERVRKGGHDVPRDKIVERYHRSMDNLLSAIRATSRAYVYDNSGSTAFLVAEITDGKVIRIANSDVPVWFRRYVLDYGT